MSGRITEKQRRFAAAYRETGSARQAAERAGYAPRKAAQALRSAGVQACLAELEGADANVASAREVLEYLTGVMRGEGDEGRQGAATPRMKAAELLGKRLGAFNEAPAGVAPPVILDDIPRPEGGEPSAGSMSSGGG